MARMNDLLNKYDVRPSGRAVQAEPPSEPTRPDVVPEWTESPESPEIPDVPEMTGDPSREKFRIKSGSPAAPEEPETGGCSGGNPGSRRPSWRKNDEAGTMPGVFGRSRGRGNVQPERDWESEVVPAEPRPVQLLRGLADHLPPLWGVDIGLILISFVGIIAILINLSAVLRALARFICSLIGVGINIMLLLAIGVAFLIFLRRPPRSRR